MVTIDSEQLASFRSDGTRVGPDEPVDVDVSDLMDKMDGHAKIRKVLVKGRHLTNVAHCELERHNSGNKIYIQENPTPEQQARVGLQFLYALHLSVNNQAY